MEINIKRVHVGAEIERRRVELGISKSELGRRIGVTQQHVNRILVGKLWRPADSLE